MPPYRSPHAPLDARTHFTRRACRSRPARRPTRTPRTAPPLDARASWCRPRRRIPPTSSASPGTGIVPGAPSRVGAADKAGLKAGDWLVTLDGQPLVFEGSTSAWSDAGRTPVRFGVIRSGQRLDVSPPRRPSAARSRHGRSIRSCTTTS